MKSKLVALIATTITLTLGAHAQATTEYSHASSAGAGAGLGSTSKALGAATNRIAEKLNAAGKATNSGTRAGSVRTVDSGAATGKSTSAVRDKAGPGMTQPLAKAGPPAVFILSNGEKIESRTYFLTVESLQVEQDGTPRVIPMSNVNVDATMAANRQRGINLKVPSNKAQIMVSF